MNAHFISYSFFNWHLYIYFFTSHSWHFIAKLRRLCKMHKLHSKHCKKRTSQCTQKVFFYSHTRYFNFLTIVPLVFLLLTISNLALTAFIVATRPIAKRIHLKSKIAIRCRHKLLTYAFYLSWMSNIIHSPWFPSFFVLIGCILTATLVFLCAVYSGVTTNTFAKRKPIISVTIAKCSTWHALNFDKPRKYECTFHFLFILQLTSLYIFLYQSLMAFYRQIAPPLQNAQTA